MYMFTTKSELDFNDLKQYAECVIKFENNFYIKAINAGHALVLKNNIVKLSKQIDKINDSYLKMYYKLALIGIDCDLSYQIRGGRYD